MTTAHGKLLKTSFKRQLTNQLYRIFQNDAEYACRLHNTKNINWDLLFELLQRKNKWFHVKVINYRPSKSDKNENQSNYEYF